jgi:hypothetical protein
VSWWNPGGIGGKITDAWQATGDILGNWLGNSGDAAMEGFSDIASGVGGIVSDLILEPIEEVSQGNIFGAQKQLLSGVGEAAGHAVQATFGAGQVALAPVSGVGWGNIGTALSAPYEYLVEPAVSGELDALRAAAGGSFRDGVSMDEVLGVGKAAFDLADPTRLGTEGVTQMRQKFHGKYDGSIGQSTAMLASPDPRDRAAVQAFQQGAMFKMVAGTTDVIAPFLLDPLNVLTPLSGVAKARYLIHAGDDMSQLAAKKQAVKFVNDIDGMSATEIRNKYFQNHQFGAQLSTEFANATDAEQKMLILRASGGDLSALDALGARDVTAANRLRRSLGDQRLLRASGYTTNDPDSLFYSEDLMSINREIEALYPELERQQRLQFIEGTLSSIPRSSFANDIRVNMTRSDWYQTKAGAPLRTVYQMRAHPFVNLDASDGDVQIARSMNEMPFSLAEKDEWRARYMGAANTEQRRVIAEGVQDEAQRRILDHYGYDPIDAGRILEFATNGRANFQRTRQTFAPGGKGVLEFVEDGVTVRIKPPLSVTQNDQITPLVNLREFEKMAKKYSPLKDRNARRFTVDPDSGRKIMTSPKEKIDVRAGRMAKAELDRFQTLWKASVVLRPAYVLRVPLGEEQVRIMGLMGALEPFKYARTGIHNTREDWRVMSDVVESKRSELAEELGRAPSKTEMLEVRRRVLKEYRVNDRVRGTRDIEEISALGHVYSYDGVFQGGGKPYQHMASTSATSDRTMGRSTDAISDELKRQIGDFQGTNDWQNNFAWTDEVGLQGDQQRGQWNKAYIDFTHRHVSQDEVYRKVVEQALRRPEQNFESLRKAAATAEQHWMLDSSQRNISDVMDQEIIDWLLSPAGNHYYQRMGRDLKRDLNQWLTEIRDVAETYLPTPELKQAALDRKVTTKMLDETYANTPRPQVHGERIAWGRADNPVHSAKDKIVDRMWNGIAKLPTEILSRNQVMDHYYKQEMSRLIDLRTRQGARVGEMGKISDEDVAKMQFKARQSALGYLKRNMYDLAEESDLSHTLKFVSPFFRAWQEVLTVWGRIAVENPTFINQVRHTWEAPDRAGLITTDDDGREYLMLPVPDWMQKQFPGGSLRNVSELKISKTGLNVVLTGTPGSGPIAGIAISHLTRDNPEVRSSKALQLLFPYGVPDSPAQAAFGATLIRNITSTIDEDNARHVSTVRNIYAAQMMDFTNGLRSTRPDWEEIEQQAERVGWLRTVVNAVAPSSVGFIGPFQPYIDTYRALQQNNPETADQIFYDNYGAEYFALVTSTSKANMSFPPTIEAWREYKKNEDVFKDFPEYAGIVLGSGAGAGAFNSNVYQWQLRTRVGAGTSKRIREIQDPREAFEAQRQDAGWMEFNRLSQMLTNELTARGLTDFNDPRAKDLKKARNFAVYQLTVDFPEWEKEFNVLDLGKWDRKVKGLEKLVQAPSLMGRPEIEGLREYLEVRGSIYDEMLRRANERGTSLLNANLGSNRNSDLAQAWISTRTALAERNPAFETLMNRYLARDTMGADEFELAGAGQ